MNAISPSGLPPGAELKKQFIFMKNYPDCGPNHFWPLNPRLIFLEGGAEGPLHYYGS